MTWKELKDKISLMTEEEQQQEVAVWGEYLNLMKVCPVTRFFELPEIIGNDMIDEYTYRTNCI